MRYASIICDRLVKRGSDYFEQASRSENDACRIESGSYLTGYIAHVIVNGS